MGTRGRVWRVGKWVGLVTASFLVLLLPVAVNYDIGYVTSGLTIVWLNGGEIRIERLVGPADQVAMVTSSIKVNPFFRGVRWGWHADRRSPAGISEYWEALRNMVALPRVNPTSATNFSIGPTRDVGGEVIFIPLGLPILALISITGLLWYGDRGRGPAGHCRRCGYDLNKNESGRCPECGVTIPASRVEPPKCPP